MALAIRQFARYGRIPHYDKTIFDPNAIPPEALSPRLYPVFSPPNSRVAYISLVGPVNTGKSTLLNHWTKCKISAVSSKAQTTRSVITGIWTQKETQIIFSDTPGLLEPKHRKPSPPCSATVPQTESTDTILYTMDIETLHRASKIYLDHIKHLQTTGLPFALLLTKTDLLSADTEKRRTRVQALEKQIKQDANLSEAHPFFAVSCRHAERQSWEALENYVIAQAKPNRQWPFASEQKHIKSDLGIVEEILREKIYMRLNQEVPYNIGVRVYSWKNRKYPVQCLHIYIALIIPHERIRPIILGKDGTVLQFIQSRAEADLEKYFNKKTILSLAITT